MGGLSAVPNLYQQLKAVQANQAAASPLIPANPFGPSGMSGLAAVPNVAAAAPAVTPAPTQTMIDEAELNRRKATGSGVSQIQNPILHALAKVGDVAGSILAPNVAAFVPGTTLHHQMLLKQQEGVVQNDQANDQAAAQTASLNLQPILKQQQAALAQEKQNNLENHQADLLDQQKQHQQQQYVQNLRDHGFAPDESDPTGVKVRPLTYSEMSPNMQAANDLKGAQEEEQQAQAALNKAKNDPTSAAYQQANSRIQVARQNASNAASRLGLSKEQFELKAFGTVGGVAPPGSMQDDNGNPVGTAFQQNVRPTSTQRDAAGRADVADSLRKSILDQLKDPEVRGALGPINGRFSEAAVHAGIASPKIAKAYNDMISYGAFQAGMHPVRGIGALQYFDKVNGGLGQTPEELEGKLASGQNVMKDVTAIGTPRTQGSRQQPSIPDNSLHTFTDGGTVYNIPAEHVAEFRKDHPNAR